MDYLAALLVTHMPTKIFHKPKQKVQSENIASKMFIFNLWCPYLTLHFGDIHKHLLVLGDLNYKAYDRLEVSGT